MVSCRAAAYLGCARGQGHSEYGVSVIELSYRKLRQIKADPPIPLKVYSAQLDRVEGHGDLVYG